MRTIGLNTDLWLDEVVSLVRYFRLPFDQVIRAYESPNQHLLYSILASASLHTFGESSWAVRLPSVLAGVAGVAAVYALGIRVADRREAIAAALLTAVSYHHVWFSQNARGYAVMMLFTAWGTARLLDAIEENKPRDWAAWTIAMALAICAIHNAAFVLAAQLAAAIVCRRRPVSVAAGAIAAGLLALAAHGLILDRMLAFWATEDRTGMGGGMTTAALFGQVVARGLAAGWTGAGALLGGAFLAWGWWSFWKTDRFAALVFALPAAFNAAAILVLQYGAYPRAFLYMLPPAMILLVRGCARIEPKVPFAWSAGALAIVSAVSLLHNYRYPKQNYSGAIAAARSRLQPGDAIAGAGMAGGVYRLYYAPNVEHLTTTDELHALEGRSRRVYVLYSFPRDMRLRYSPLYDELESRYDIVQRFPGTLDDGTIWLVRQRL